MMKLNLVGYNSGCFCTYVTGLRLLLLGVWFCLFLNEVVNIDRMTVSPDLVKEQKGLKIVHVNSWSIIQHFDELQVAFLDGSLDVVIFTESWLHANCADSLIHVRGYTIYRHDRQTKTKGGVTKRGGGIIAYIKEGINVITWPDLDVSNEDIESMSLSCKQGMHRKVNVTIVYRPPTGKLQLAIDKIESTVESIKLTTSGDTVVVGDLNTDLFCT